MQWLARVVLFVGVAGAAGCGARQGLKLRHVDVPAPPAVPQTWDLSTPEARDEARPLAMAACEWYLDTAPATADAKAWVRTRNFALDWIEASTSPPIAVVQPIVAYVATDTRFLYGVYMRGAYQCGKAAYLLAHPPVANQESKSISMPAELAGIAAMHRLFAALKQWDPHTYSRRLNKLRRKQKHGHIEPFLWKRIAKGGAAPSRRRR